MRLADAIAGEFRKARTLPSLLVALGASLLLTILYGLASAPGAARMLIERPANAAEGLTAEAAGTHMFLNMSFLPIVVSVLVVASEYVGGQLATSSLATPKRSKLVIAKLVVVVVVSLIQALFASSMILTWFQGSLGEHSVFATGEGIGEALTKLALGSLYWVFLGLFSAAVALIVRSQTVVMAALVVMSGLGLVPLMISKAFQYLPTMAGVAMVSPETLVGLPGPPDLSPAEGTIVNLAWVSVTVAAAFIVFLRRDVGAKQLVVE